MPEYSTSTATDQDSGSADRSGSATTGDAGATDASSRSERSDLSPGSVTTDADGSDRPSVGAGEHSADSGVGTRDAGEPAADAQGPDSADGGSGTREAGEPAADAQGPDSADGGVGIRDGGSDIGEGGMSTPDAASAQGRSGDSDVQSPAGTDNSSGTSVEEGGFSGSTSGGAGYSGEGHAPDHTELGPYFPSEWSSSDDPAPGADDGAQDYPNDQGEGIRAAIDSVPGTPEIGPLPPDSVVVPDDWFPGKEQLEALTDERLGFDEEAKEIRPEITPGPGVPSTPPPPPPPEVAP